jgi:hypothetical protein
VAARVDERLACDGRHGGGCAGLVGVPRVVLRLLHAIDAVAFGPSGIWNGRAACRA